VRGVALGSEIDVECQGDDIAVLDALVGVVAADTLLQLKSVGDGVLDLTATGVTVFDFLGGADASLDQVQWARPSQVGLDC